MTDRRNRHPRRWRRNRREPGRSRRPEALILLPEELFPAPRYGPRGGAMTSPDSAPVSPIRSGLPLDLAPIVLLADDERVLRELLCDSLEEEFRVLVAENGQDAL